MTADWPAASKPPVSLANSAAILRYPQTAHAWARPGIMLYGGSPFADQDAASFDLKPVMTLHSRILAVQEIGVGERVGYGGTFVAPAADASRRRRLRLCRWLSRGMRPGGTPIHRRRSAHADPRSGVDGHARLRPDRLPDARGRIVRSSSGARALPADEVAAAAGTISYELFCALARRVPVVEI
jgi:alanine racemase